MNNWRLLLLAVVAVFQPIASFTDSNLIDGRQQCCDRLPSAPLQDTRSSLHGTYQLGKTTPALRRLNGRDEIREDHRYELRQRDSIFSRPSTVRPLVDIRGNVVRQGPFEISRSFRVEHRLERSTNSQSRKRQLDGHQREETARANRDLKHQDLTRRAVDRNSRDTLERRNDRVYAESPRDSLFRGDYKTERFGNELLFKNLFDSQPEMHRDEIRSVEGRITLNNDARLDFSRTQHESNMNQASNMNNRQRIAKERMSAERSESSIRPNTRRYSEQNNESQGLQRSNQERRTLSASTRSVDRIPNRFNAREYTRENRQRIRANQRLSTERFEERREQGGDRRESRQENKENIDRSVSDERRLQVARRMTRESRIINVLNTENERNVDRQREIRQVRLSREIQGKIRENLEHRLFREKIMMDRTNIRESRLVNAQNTRDVANRREIRKNEGLARETRDENRGNLEQRFSRERIQMDRRDIHDSTLINARNTRDVAERREIRHTERMIRETRDENRDNLGQRSRERIQMERRHNRESRLLNAQNTRNIADRREIRKNERLATDTREENKENLDQRLSREKIVMDRRDIRESRLINARNTRDVADRREIRQNEKMTRETREENRDNLEQRFARDRSQMDRRDTRNPRITQTVRSVVDRREMRHSESNTRDERENHINRLTVERSTADRRNVRKFRVINNLISCDDDRRIHSKIASRLDNRMSREIRDENRSREERHSREKIQTNWRNIREFRTVSTPNDKDIVSRQEVRYTARSTEKRKEARLNPEQIISRESIQMDRRNIRELRNINIAIRTKRDVESQREIRNNARLHTENRENPDNRLVRERIQTGRRNTHESRIGNTLNIKDLDSRQERESRETREEMRENLDRRLARETRQVDRRNTRESRINGVATHGKIVGYQREIRNNERVSGQIRSDRATRERRVESSSADRVNFERDSSMMHQRARSADQRNFREIRTVHRLSRPADSERRSEVFRSRVEHSHNIENREREAISRERNSVMVGKMETESDFTVANWRYVLYTLQGAYLCALFMQMLTPSHTGKAHKLSLRWLPVSSHYNPIKVD